MRKSPSPSPTLKLQQGRSQEARPTLSSSDCGTPRKSAATAFASSSVTLSAPSSDFAVTDSAEAEYLPSYSSSGNSSSSESMRRSSAAHGTLFPVVGAGGVAVELQRALGKLGTELGSLGRKVRHGLGYLAQLFHRLLVGQPALGALAREPERQSPALFI